MHLSTLHEAYEAPLLARRRTSSDADSWHPESLALQLPPAYAAAAAAPAAGSCTDEARRYCTCFSVVLIIIH